MALEILVGLVIGLVASLPLVAMQMGGLLKGSRWAWGLQPSQPRGGEDADVLGQLLFFLLVGFLVVSGHEAIMTAVMNSFGHVPLGGFVIDAGLVSFVTGMMLAAFEVAIRVAAPVLAIIFLQSIAMGFVSRTVPQLNILSLGFPLRILVGFAVLIAGLAVIEEVGMQAIDDTLHAIMNWVQVT